MKLAHVLVFALAISLATANTSRIEVAARRRYEAVAVQNGMARNGRISISFDAIVDWLRANLKSTSIRVCRRVCENGMRLLAAKFGVPLQLVGLAIPSLCRPPCDFTVNWLTEQLKGKRHLHISELPQHWQTVKDPAPQDPCPACG